MKHFFLSVVLLLASMSFAQQRITKLTYYKIDNAKVDSSQTYSLLTSKTLCSLSPPNAKVQEWIDFERAEAVSFMRFDSILYKAVQPFAELPMPMDDAKVKSIFKYKTRKCKYFVFSNTIEVWYTHDTDAKGGPYASYVPQDALVLKLLVNGNRGWQLSAIEKEVEQTMPSYGYKAATTISKPQARAKQIAARYVNVPVFDKVQLNWGDAMEQPDSLRAGIAYRFAGGTVVLKKVKLPAINRQRAQVFATLTNWSNGDAYDRTGSLFTIAGDKKITVLDAYMHGLERLPVIEDNAGNKYQGLQSTDDYEVPVELMRFFTSFGVGHFNTLRSIEGYHWQDSVVYKQEITSLIPNDEDEIWLGVFIGNYDGGGHHVSLALQFYPAWEPDPQPANKFILPLFNTVNTLEMRGQNYGKMFRNDTLELSFDMPEGVQQPGLLYTSTGHGGWGGGDEFNPKLNQIFIDGKLVFSVMPWRSDCGCYRMSNPASGNFGNGLSSSDLSRSNWCPATLTPPYRVPLQGLAPGRHSIQVVIDMGSPEGNSFSSWGVSCIITGQLPPGKE